jgi:hypothetical protein
MLMVFIGSIPWHFLRSLLEFLFLKALLWVIGVDLASHYCRERRVEHFLQIGRAFVFVKIRVYGFDLEYLDSTLHYLGVFGRHEPAKLFKYLNELVVLYRVTGRIVQTLCDGRRQHVFARVPGLDDFCFKTGNA